MIFDKDAANSIAKMDAARKAQFVDEARIKVDDKALP
jgi:hypothetical protein